MSRNPQETEHVPPGEHLSPGEHAHPKEREYIKVAIVLAIVTALEVAIYYLESVEALLVPLLLLFSLIKFALVVLWFMHLRFDSRTYARFFMVGIAFAVTLYVIVLISLGVWVN